MQLTVVYPDTEVAALKNAVFEWVFVESMWVSGTPKQSTLSSLEA